MIKSMIVIAILLICVALTLRMIASAARGHGLQTALRLIGESILLALGGAHSSREG
jgi:hypothetical protein